MISPAMLTAACHTLLRCWCCPTMAGWAGWLPLELAASSESRGSVRSEESRGRSERCEDDENGVLRLPSLSVRREIALARVTIMGLAHGRVGG